MGVCIRNVACHDSCELSEQHCSKYTWPGVNTSSTLDHGSL